MGRTNTQREGVSRARTTSPPTRPVPRLRNSYSILRLPWEGEVPGLSFATAVSSSGPSVEWEAPEMAAERLPDPSGGKCPVASPTPGRPTQIHPLLCCRHSPYQFFGRLLLGFPKQPHGLLNSSCPFRLSVARAQAGHGQPPGRSR